MIPDRQKTVAFTAALVVTSCGGAVGTAPHASGDVQTQPAPASAGGHPSDRRDSVGDPIDPSKPKGHLPPEVIQTIVHNNFGVMRRCYEEGLGRDPTLKGSIATKFVIDRDGTVSTAADIHDVPATAVAPSLLVEKEREDVDAPRFPDPKVTACVVAQFKELRFPPPQGGIITVIYPLIFHPGER
jgi:hypothetical protein